MSTIYLDASKRRPYPRLPGVHGVAHLISQGGGDRDTFDRALKALQGNKNYFAVADTLVIAAANSCNVAAMELLLDTDVDAALQVDVLRGLQFQTLDLKDQKDQKRGRPLPVGCLPEGSWKRMPAGYSTTLPIHQVIRRGNSPEKSLSMVSLLIERAGVEQLSVCTRLGEWVARPSSNSRIGYTAEPIGGTTPLMTALEEGHLKSADLMLSKDPGCADAKTTTGLRIEQLFIPSQEARRLLQAHRAAVHARSVVANIVNERSEVYRRSSTRATVPG